MNDSLSEVLTTTETATPATSSETEATADSSLTTTETAAAEQPQPEQVEAKPETIDQVRNWGKGWETTAKGYETELGALKTQFDNFGGEAQLSTMQPFAVALRELPQNDDQVEAWAPGAVEALSKSVLPSQFDGLRAEMAWSYIRDPAGAQLITDGVFGEGVPVDALFRFANLYRNDPTILDDPNETYEQRQARERYETAQRQMEESTRANNAFREQSEAREAAQVAQGIEREGFTVVANTRSEIKKQFGLSEATQGDTPEVAYIKNMMSNLYERLSYSGLMMDQQLNHSANRLSYLAKQQDAAQRGRAVTENSPAMEKRTRVVCGQIAKELADLQSRILGGNSDQAIGNNLRELKPNVLGGGAGAVQGGGQLPALGSTDQRNQMIEFIRSQQTNPIVRAS